MARYGVLVSFLNRFSFYHYSHGLAWPWRGPGATIEARWFSCLEMRRLVLGTLGPKQWQCGSVLPGPVWTWKPGAPWNVINRPVYPLGVGAYGAMRADFTAEKPLTPCTC